MGVEPYSGVDFPHNENEPIFKHWFPQHSGKKGIPNLYERKSYFHHELGDKLLILSLDTGYEAAMEEEQLEWMKRILENSKAEIKIIQFHAPVLGSTNQQMAGDKMVEEIGLKHWIPLFDKHNVTIISQNHSHTFARSKKLKEMKEDANGTLYIGEGSWGFWSVPDKVL